MPKIMHIGTGRCRGPDWAAKVWPILLGRKSIDECARECASRKRCMAFDMSDMHSKKNNTGECALYGHTKVRSG